MSAYVLTEQAAQDLQDIWDYIADKSVDSADAVLRDIPEALELLASMPNVGHRRKDVRDSRYRFWRANRFIVAYFRDTQPLQIIRVVGGSQNIRKMFRKR
jgi:plasmid stabilization system protein ParE